MRWFDTLRLTTRSLLLRNRVESELDAELRFHIDRQTDEDLRAGMSAEAARLSALRATGSVMPIKEQCRESLGLRLLDEWRQDVRYALTSFRHSLGFTAVAIFTLGLGIGANTAMFSAVDSVLIKPLPFPDPDRLVSIRETNLRNGGSASVSSGNFVDWKDHVQALESVATWRFDYFNIAGRDEPEQVQGYRIAASYLPLLGANGERPFVPVRGGAARPRTRRRPDRRAMAPPVRLCAGPRRPDHSSRWPALHGRRHPVRNVCSRPGPEPPDRHLRAADSRCGPTGPTESRPERKREAQARNHDCSGPSATR